MQYISQFNIMERFKYLVVSMTTSGGVPASIILSKSAQTKNIIINNMALYVLCLYFIYLSFGQGIVLNIDQILFGTSFISASLVSNMGPITLPFLDLELLSVLPQLESFNNRSNNT